MLVALKLSDAGYYQGNPDNVLKARVDHVIAIIHYENFKNKYDRKYMELNDGTG